MKRSKFLFWSSTSIVWMAILGTVCGFSDDKSENKSNAGTPSGSRLLILHSSELKGYLEPCGCFKPHIGGFLRRASYLKGIKDPSIRIDNGDLTLADGRQSEIKAETAIFFFNELKYDAINLGPKDYKLGLTYLQTLKEMFTGAMLSANVKDAQGKPYFGEYKIFERTVNGKKVKVAVIGLLSQSHQQEVSSAVPGTTIESPDDTLMRLEQQVKGNADYVALLYHGKKEEAAEIAKNFNWIKSIVYAEASDSAVDPVKVGDTYLLQPGQKGKYIGEAPLTLNSSGKLIAEKPRNVTLDPHFTDDKSAMDIRVAYQQRVKAENLILAVKKMPTANGAKYVGTDKCMSCHTEPHNVWLTSRHGKAFKTLQDIGHEADPECVGCHVVGLDKMSGFVSFEKTPKLKDVGCESCHGPASKHVEEAAAMPKIGQEVCANCHVPDHSPSFDFQTYWNKIKH